MINTSEKTKNQQSPKINVMNPTITTPIRNYEPTYDEAQKHNQPVLIQNFNGNTQQAYNFYTKEVNKLFFANMVLKSQLKNAFEEKKQLAEIITSLERTDKNSQEERKKRHRRPAADIQRAYKCPAPKCGKSYGSQGSLSQHLKLKHPECHYQGEKGDSREEDPC